MAKKHKKKNKAQPAEFVERRSRPRSYLFDMPTQTEREWRGMPEYVSRKLEAFRTIIVRFRNQEDVDAFEKSIDQLISSQTTSLWYPQLQYTRFNEHWIDDDGDDIM